MARHAALAMEFRSSDCGESNSVGAGRAAAFDKRDRGLRPGAIAATFHRAGGDKGRVESAERLRGGAGNWHERTQGRDARIGSCFAFVSKILVDTFPRSEAQRRLIRRPRAYSTVTVISLPC